MYASKLMLASAVRFFSPVHTSTPWHNRQAWVPIEVIRTTPAYYIYMRASLAGGEYRSQDVGSAPRSTGPT